MQVQCKSNQAISTANLCLYTNVMSNHTPFTPWPVNLRLLISALLCVHSLSLSPSLHPPSISPYPEQVLPGLHSSRADGLHQTSSHLYQTWLVKREKKMLFLHLLVTCTMIVHVCVLCMCIVYVYIVRHTHIHCTL